jgi:hypothetical protein
MQKIRITKRGMRKLVLIILRELRILDSREQAADLPESGSSGEFGIFLLASGLPLAASTLGGRNR